MDLGTRCTVFMNSMVKQAQKEGASIGDICRGARLYSVIKNALYKVIKLRDVSEAGDKYRRAGRYVSQRVRSCARIETVLGKEVDAAGYRRSMMGAYGCALIGIESILERTDALPASCRSGSVLGHFSMTGSMHTPAAVGCENQLSC